MATEAQQISGVQSDLAQLVDEMLAAHEFGLAVHSIRTAVNELDFIPPLFNEKLQALEDDYVDEIEYLFNP